MSEPINDGGPAFPIPDSHHASGHVKYGSKGMTLRDWFAGQSITEQLRTGNAIKGANADDVAKACYEVADAMLKARLK